MQELRLSTYVYELGFCALKVIGLAPLSGTCSAHVYGPTGEVDFLRSGGTRAGGWGLLAVGELGAGVCRGGIGLLQADIPVGTV